MVCRRYDSGCKVVERRRARAKVAGVGIALDTRDGHSDAVHQIEISAALGVHLGTANLRRHYFGACQGSCRPRHAADFEL